MLEATLILANEKATLALGAALAPALRKGDVLCLSGPLGAGKTTLARGLISALTREEAPSPTFALVETYEAEGLALWHFDLYRLEKPQDVWELGLEEAFAEGASLIEWPERIAAHIPSSAHLIRLADDGDGRRASVHGDEAWSQRLKKSGLFSSRESINKD